jgi:mono/diheme cytochrome c family protein
MGEDVMYNWRATLHRPWFVLLFAFASQAVAGTDGFDAAESFRMNCAPCHGANGRMNPEHPLHASFKSPPADFREPRFNSMEPSADWFMVTKYGGTPMGLSDQMPAYGDALTDEEIEAVVAHLKTLADTENYPPGDLNLLRPIRTIKAFPETEALYLNRYAKQEDGTSTNKHTLYYGQRFGSRWQGELKFSSLDVPVGDDEEEVEVGVKWAFHDDLKRQLLLSTGLEAEIPLDSADGPTIYVPYFSFAHVPSDAWTIQGTLRSHLPAGDTSSGDVEISAVAHWMHSPWPRRPFPGLELVWTEPFEGDTEIAVIPQVFAGINRRGHVALSVGVEVPVSGLDDRDYRVHAFLLWDIADGMFWEGW